MSRVVVGRRWRSTVTSDIDRRAIEVASGLLDRTLPKSAWTHEGHVLACVALVRTGGPVDALATLRAAIPPYNEATGVANTATGGYHDTLTVYYVWAVHRLVAAGLDTAVVLLDESVARDGPLAWWPRDVLMSTRARSAWLPPTVVPEGWDPAEPGPHEWYDPV